MRHGKKFNHLGRTSSHRKAMLANMAISLLMYKRISTTVAKAKELKKYVEPLITKSKSDTTHSRRVVFSYLQNNEAVTELFNEVANKVGERPGGYTRIIKMPNRLGDNAEMCIIELVDYNELLLNDTTERKSSSRRRRRKKKSSNEQTQQEAVETTASNEGESEDNTQSKEEKSE